MEKIFRKQNCLHLLQCFFSPNKMFSFRLICPELAKLQFLKLASELHNIFMALQKHLKNYFL